MRQVSTSIAIQLRNMFAHFSRNEVASTGANAFKKYCFQRIVWGKWNEVSQRKSWRGSAKENSILILCVQFFSFEKWRGKWRLKRRKAGGKDWNWNQPRFHPSIFLLHAKLIQRLPLFGLYFFNINSGARPKYN